MSPCKDWVAKNLNIPNVLKDNNGDLAVCMSHELDQLGERFMAKNAFQVLGHILGNVLVTPKVLSIGEHLGNSHRSLHTCIREHHHGRETF